MAERKKTTQLLTLLAWKPTWKKVKAEFEEGCGKET